MNVNRKELINQLKEKYGYTKKSAAALIDDFTGIILDNMRQGNSVSLSGFGCFDILERAARRCPHPQTGETVEIPSHWVPRFYPYKQMRMQVKFWESEEEGRN